MMLRTVFSRFFPSQARIHIAPPPLFCTRSRYSCSFQPLPPQKKIEKKVGSALELQQKQNKARFHRALLQAIQISMLEDKKRKLETLKSEDKKVYSSDLLQEEASDLYKGEFNGTLKGYMRGKKFKGKFEGTVYSGIIVKENFNGKILKEEMPNNSQPNPDQQMTIQDAVFQGTFVGSASQGHLIGSMMGAMNGYRVLASDMQEQWQKCPFTLSYQEITPIINQFYDLDESGGLKSIRQLSPRMKSFFQSLNLRGICEFDQNSMRIFQPKHSLSKFIDKSLKKYINKTVISLLQTFAFDQQAFYSQYNKFVMSGLSKLDLALQIAGEKIKLVNRRQENTFISFNDQATNFGQRFGQLVERVQKLPQGQGLGARPVSKKLKYSDREDLQLYKSDVKAEIMKGMEGFHFDFNAVLIKGFRKMHQQEQWTSKTIDTVLIYKNTKKQTWFITLGYSLGEASDAISKKIRDHRQFYQQRLLKDFQKSEQKLNFKDRYMHYIVVRDDVYDKSERQLQNQKDYQKVIKLTQLRFEFEPQPFSDTAESHLEAAQKMIAASIFASKLSLK